MKQNTIQNIRPLLGLLVAVGLGLLGTVTLAALLTGCVKRELEMRPVDPEEGTVDVSVGWPAGIDCRAARLLIYDDSGALNGSEEFSAGENRFTFRLAAGSYRLILHNTDAQNVDYAATENHVTAEVYALNASGQKPASSGELLAEPRKVYGIGSHDRGDRFSVTAGETQQLNVSPVRLTRDVLFYFEVSGLDAVQAIEGTLRGVAPSVLLSTRECRQVSFGLPFVGESYTPLQVQSPVRPATKAANEALRFRSTLELFDLLTRKESPAGTNVIETKVTDGDGKPYFVQVDITATLQQLIENNGGTLPVEVPLTVKIEVDPVTAEVRATVTPWDESGSGGGDFE